MSASAAIAAAIVSAGKHAQDGKSVQPTEDTTKAAPRPAVRLQELYQHTTLVLCRLDKHPHDYKRAIIMRPSSYEDAIAAIIKVFGATNIYQTPKSKSNLNSNLNSYAPTSMRVDAAPSLRCRLRSSDNYWMDVDPQCWDLLVDHMEFLLVNRWTREEVDLGVPNYGY